MVTRRTHSDETVKRVSMRLIAHQIIIILILAILILSVLLGLLHKHSAQVEKQSAVPVESPVYTIENNTAKKAVSDQSEFETVWIEGEHPQKHTTQKHVWYDKVDKSRFSGNDWISHYDEHGTGSAEYSFSLKGGEYDFWLRANPYKCTMTFSVDGGENRAIDFSNPINRIMISDEPDIRFIGWVRVGRFRIPAGTHTIVFRFSSMNGNHGGIDCFTFTTQHDYIPENFEKPEGCSTVSTDKNQHTALKKSD